MKLTPLGERVILRPIKQTEEKTRSGLYLPKSEDKKQGIIEELGPSKDPLPLKKGDKVLYGGYSSEELELEGEKFLIIETKDIIAKLEDN